MYVLPKMNVNIIYYKYVLINIYKKKKEYTIQVMPPMAHLFQPGTTS